jgi:hypothetical protein
MRWNIIRNVVLPYRKYLNHPVYNYAGLVIIYICLVVFLPASKQVMSTYHLNVHEYHILLLTVQLPTIIMWFAAFYGYKKLREYAASIENTKEGGVFAVLARGFHWLAWGLILPSIFGLTFSSIANRYHSFYEVSIILENYFYLVFPVIAYSVMSDSAQSLLSQVKIKSSRMSMRILLIMFVTLATLYCYLTFRHLDLNHISSTNNPYFLPVWLLIVSMIIPYLYAWIIGLVTAYEYGLFAHQAKGIIYRRALQFVALGVALVIVGSIGYQYLHTVIPRTGHLSLDAILLATYGFYVCITLGFSLSAYGATRLKKIEDI